MSHTAPEHNESMNSSSRPAQPNPFAKSYEQYKSYPKNLLPNPTGHLNFFHQKEWAPGPNCFISGGQEHFRVCVLDVENFVRCKPAFQFHEFNSSAELQNFLRPTNVITPSDSTPVFREDPPCRFVFLSANGPRSPLNLDKDSLLRLLSYFQITTDFMDFVSMFSKHAYLEGTYLSDFRVHTQFLSRCASRELTIDELGRSDRRYQICFNLKVANPPNSDHRSFKALNAKPHWTVTPVVLHHQFDIDNGKMLWVTIQGNRGLEEFLRSNFEKDREWDAITMHGALARFQVTLDIHKSICRWNLSGWLNYIKTLEADMNTIRSAKGFTVPPIGHAEIPAAQRSIESTFVILNIREESVRARNALESNICILDSLVQFYRDTVDTNMANPPLTGEDNIQIWQEKVSSFGRDVGNLKCQFQRLVDRSKVVSANLEDFRNRTLQEVEFRTTQKMERLGELAHRQGVSVMIMTAVVILFLPPGAVSAFLGTGVVKFCLNPENQVQGTSLCGTALGWWLVATTIVYVLVGTFVTLMTKIQASLSKNREELLVDAHPGGHRSSAAIEVNPA